jgi:uncharacterized protein (TIGR00106 family)
LDLDLLLYGDLRVSQPGLEVPHPRMHERGFVLEPLCELACDLVHPRLGVRVATLAERVRDPSRVRPWSAGVSSPKRRKHVAIAAVSIAPVGVGTSVGRFVAAALRVAQRQRRVRHRLDPMFTTLEGELSEIFALIQRMQEAVFEAGAARVSTVIKIDERRDQRVSMEDKPRSVERALSRSAKRPRAACSAGGVKRRGRTRRA